MQTENATKCGGRRLKGILAEETTDRPLITVVTAVFNAFGTIEATIESVLGQTYGSVEYIIIDGGSTDGTLDIIRKYEHAVDYWISEPDKGIYDAMNKGIRTSRGTWLNFLNAGDVFSNHSVLESIAKIYFCSDARFIYSDVLLSTGGRTVNNPPRVICDHKRLIINHQSSIYRKDLHFDHGMYLVAPGITISDYLFFSLVGQNDYLKADYAIAIYDTAGVSQLRKAVEQKIIVDYLINGMPRYKFFAYFHLYHYYRNAKAALARLWRGRRS